MAMMIAVVAVGLDGAEGSGEVSSAKRNGRANGGRSKVDRKVSSASGVPEPNHVLLELK